jgi:type I restriction enzyme S subunit
MRKLQVKDVLTRVKEPIELEDDVLYKRVTIKTKHQGVFLRDSQYGKDIGTKKQFFIKKGQFLLSKIDARNGAFGIVSDEVDGAIITGNFWTYEVNEKELNIELFYIMTSLPFFDELCKNASSGSTNRQYLDEKKFLNQEITLPPIEEQNSFIKHFKKLQEKHSQTLEELQTQSELINKLRSSILSDAVSGKLVPQDPNDESAEVLLEKIKAQKEKLIQEGKIKNQKPLPLISEDEIPYELPDGWMWCRLGILIKTLQNGISKREGSKGKLVPVLRLADITNKQVDLNDTRSILLDEKEQEKYSVGKNDILITRVNGSIDIVGNFNTCNNVDLLIAYCDHFMRMNFLNEELSSYIALVEQTSIIRDVIKRVFKSTAGQKTVNQGHINSLLVPLPPIEEQNRIVEKVEKLMATCDALDFEVQNSKTETEKLMQSVLKEAFEN